LGYNTLLMLENIPSILTHMCALDPARPVLVGVSGGPDSLCLLHVLHSSGYPLVVACLDHGLRPESTSEVGLVQHIAETLGAVFVSKSVDTPQFASQMGLSIEAAARQLRYEFLFTEAARFDAQAVAVGHTADDQAETVLMHLLRGAGLAGLKGMQFRTWHTSFSPDLPLVRPLLNTWRSEVLEYCRLNHLTPAQDVTNQSLNYFRNRLRLEVLPFLEQVQPNLRQHLVRMAGTLALDYELLLSHVQTAWDALLVDRGQGYLAFHRVKFLACPLPLQRHLLRQAMLSLRTAAQDIELAMVERARLSLDMASGHRTCDVGAGLQLYIERDTFWVIVRGATLPAGDWPAVLPHQVLELPIPGELVLPAGWVFQAEIITSPMISACGTAAGVSYQAWFDAARLTSPLIVRQRQPGDRIQPSAMGGKSVKLSDLMINFKLPYRSRATWPVVCASDQIVWVPGCRQSHLALPEQNTQVFLRLRLLRLPSGSETS
jgi:tRNA(Ile)-lysidine synthase